MRSVVLVSGGMDSATALGQVVNNPNTEEILAVSLSYGSIHNAREGRAAEELASYYGVELAHVQLNHSIFAGGESALLGEQAVPSEEYHDIEKETPSVTVVPFRNANLISAATSIAEARGFDQVWLSVHKTDHDGWAYPDCSPEFVGAMMNAVYVGTMRKVRLNAPFLNDTKADIVRKGVALHVPYDLTYSCYRGGEVSCGECPTCKERLKAFDVAGLKDPIKYAHQL